MKIGDTLYWFDVDRRVYDKPGMGGRTIYAEHFRAEEIVGETKLSWLVGHWKTKVNKAKLTAAGRHGWGPTLYYTAEGRDAQIWLEGHKHEILRMVGRADAETIKKIAALVGYVP